MTDIIIYGYDVFKDTTRYSRRFGSAGAGVKNYQFWRHDNKPIELWSHKVILEKINYIHENPVEAGIVFKPEEYRYSSAIDYADEQGMIANLIVYRNF